MVEYIQLYCLCAVSYLIFYTFLKGFVKQEWEMQDILHGIFFPLSLANELGFLLTVIIEYVRKKYKKETNEQK